MDYGFVRVATAVPEIRVADYKFNTDRIIELIEQAKANNIQFLCFPELSITGYTCADLFHQYKLITGAEQSLFRIMEQTKHCNIVVLVGLPILSRNKLFNCAAVIQSGKVLGIIPKVYVSEHEKRWFESGQGIIDSRIQICGTELPFGTDILFQDSLNQDICFGIEVGEDLWATIPPSSYQSLGGAVITFNLSARSEFTGTLEYRRRLVEQQSARCISGYVYSSSGVWESTTDVVYSGHAMISECGNILEESERFSTSSQIISAEIDVQKLIKERSKTISFKNSINERKYRIVPFDLKSLDITTLKRKIPTHPFVPQDLYERNEYCKEIFTIQTSALAKRMRHIGVKKAVIAVSGGLDSTLALLVTVKAFDAIGLPPENIYAITMPGFGTTDTTYNNAISLMKALNVDIHEVDIKPLCLQHFKAIGHDPDLHDITYENVQARERTQITMNISNKIGGLVIGTGDLSEMVLGWCTYSSDPMSMYAVNIGVPKTLIKHIIKWIADNKVSEDTREVLYKIIDTPITPELLPPDSKGEISQKTEDIIGPYELHDFFLYHILRYGVPPKKILFLAKLAFAEEYDEQTIKKWLKVFYKRFFSQQYKRSCLPDGPKVCPINISPREGLKMPSDARVDSWLAELE